MSKGIIKSISAVFILFVLIASSALAQKPQVNILMVSVDFDAQTMTITGENFNIGPNPTTASLGGFGNLNIISNDSSTIVAELPPGISAGDYTLFVSSGPGPKKNDQQSITIGAQGPEGEMGDPGTPGDPGDQGDQGPQGPQGGQGPQGPAGPQGATGPQGADGADGVDGADGADGTDGADGADGMNGMDGADGADGALANLTCATNQIAKFDGADWVCADMFRTSTAIDFFTKLVFATSARYDGDLVAEAIANFPNCSGVTAGLDAADCICQEHADSVGLTGLYAAWLANDSGSPSTRFVQSTTQPYVTVDGRLVANDWADLIDGSIANPINIDENEIPLLSTAVVVWSHVATSGATDSGAVNDCREWAEDGSFAFGGVGSWSATNGTWTDTNFLSNCSTPLSLYCFEQ